MNNTFRLPPGITAAAVNRAANGVDSPWRRALLLALGETLSAGEIAKRAGMSRATLFRKKKVLFSPNGLTRSFTRRHGGGQSASVEGELLEHLRSWFEQGRVATIIQARLRKAGVHMSESGVYYWKRRLGFVKRR